MLGGRKAARGLGHGAVADAQCAQQPVTPDRIERIHAAERDRFDRFRPCWWGRRRGVGRRFLQFRQPLQHGRPFPRFADRTGGAAAPPAGTAAERGLCQRGPSARRGEQPARAVPCARGHAACGRRVGQVRGPGTGLARSVSIEKIRSALPPTNASVLKPRYPMSRSCRRTHQLPLTLSSVFATQPPPGVDGPGSGGRL